MVHPGFAGEMRERTSALWRAIHDHPFVCGLGDGSLGRDRFEHYLRQDYLYLISFSCVIALAAAKTIELGEMTYFSSLLELTLNTEMALHRRTCSDFGIEEEELERAEPGFITTAYASFLLRTCYEGPFGDIIAVLLPCAAGYVEIATALAESGLPENRHYRDWIETYSSSEMRELADWLVRRMNRLAEGSSPAEQNRWLSRYTSSGRFELLFFEMAWTKSTWPDYVPH